jgi:hypothetical protein
MCVLLLFRLTLCFLGLWLILCLSTHIILLIDEWGDMCFSMSMCLYFADHFNGERREVDDWYKTFLNSDFCVSVEVILWEVWKFCFQQIQGLSVYHFIFVVYFMMVWYGAFRSLVYSNAYSHFGEDWISIYILDVSGGILFGKLLYVCEYECDSRVGVGGVCCLW